MRLMTIRYISQYNIGASISSDIISDHYLFLLSVWFMQFRFKKCFTFFQWNPSESQPLYFVVVLILSTDFTNGVPLVDQFSIKADYSFDHIWENQEKTFINSKWLTTKYNIYLVPAWPIAGQLIFLFEMCKSQWKIQRDRIRLNRPLDTLQILSAMKRLNSNSRNKLIFSAFVKFPQTYVIRSLEHFILFIHDLSEWICCNHCTGCNHRIQMNPVCVQFKDWSTKCECLLWFRQHQRILQ